MNRKSVARRMVLPPLSHELIRRGGHVARRILVQRDPPQELCRSKLEGIVLLLMAEAWARGYHAGRAGRVRR